MPCRVRGVCHCGGVTKMKPVTLRTTDRYLDQAWAEPRSSKSLLDNHTKGIRTREITECYS
jgi:hypothetical protein